MFLCGTSQSNKMNTIYGLFINIIFIVLNLKYIFKNLFLGNLNDPGLIPRMLRLVFNSLNSKLVSQCKYRPDKIMTVYVLDEKLMECENIVRNNILNNWLHEETQVLL